MSWKDRCVEYMKKYGPAGKVIAGTVLNVVAPGSGALIGLVDKAFDTAHDTAHGHWEAELMRAAQDNAAELARLGSLFELLTGDLAKLCDKAFAFHDQPDDIEDIVRRTLAADRGLTDGLRKLDAIVDDFACVKEQQRQLLDGQDEMLPIMRRLQRVLPFLEDWQRVGANPREPLLHRQAILIGIQRRQVRPARLALQQIEAVGKHGDTHLFKAGIALVDHDFPSVQSELGELARRHPGDAEIVELHRRATVIATGMTPRDPRAVSPDGDTVEETGTPNLEVGATLDGWTLQARLGAGGWGQVFKAVKGAQTAALKVMHGKYSRDDDFCERFRGEIMTLSALPRHASLVRILGFNKSPQTGCWYLLMEFIDGPTLEQALAASGQSLSKAEAVAIFTQVAEGLAKAHTAGIVHRDIKPSNLILRKDKTAVLVDLGLAVNAADVGQTQLSGLTLMFGSPEQKSRLPADKRSDVYSLAATMYYALLYDKPDLRNPVHFDADEVPTELRAVMGKAMEANPRRRFADIGELHAALIALGKSAVVVKPPPQPAKPATESPGDRVRRLKTEAAKLHEDARALLERYDFEAAAELLSGFRAELVPLRDAALFADTVAKRDRLRQLHREIHERLNSGKLKDPRLPGLIAAFLKVKSNDEEMLDLAREFPAPKRGQLFTNPLGMKFAWVPPGASWLGGGDGKPGTTPFTLEQGLWCGIHPVTQAEWQQIMDSNPSNFKGNPRFPVESVSWNDVQTFLQKLNARGGDFSYRLPTEQEWEYICRGGPINQDQSKYHYYFAKSKTDLTPLPTNDLASNQANYGNRLQGPIEVGSYLPNPLGIYDLHGNIWEWTSSSEGSARAFRGGGWYSATEDCTASYRGRRGPVYSRDDLGFRVLAVPQDR